MPPTRITFSPSTIQDVGTIRVWTRARWSDEWVLAPYLWAEEVAWACAPSFPVAQLRWEYGRIMRPDSNAFSIVPKLDWSLPRYVKIEVECEFVPAENPGDEDAWTTRTWYGIAELITDQTDGATVATDQDEPEAIPTGTQTITCYGLERLLERERSQFIAFRDGDGEQTCDGLRATFNQSGIPNRSASEDSQADAYVFQHRSEIAEYWSTKEIVRYLLKYGAPRDVDDVRQINFRVRQDTYLPDWDKPEISLDQVTTLEVLQKLLHRGRLLCWWLEVVHEDEEDPESELVVELVTSTILRSALPTSLPGNHVVPAATRQLHLIYDQDPETRAVAKDSGLPVCDQVLARGSLVEYVGTFANWTRSTGLTVRQFVQGWTSQESSLYDVGAALLADYAGLDLSQQQRRNAAARSRPQFENVYSLWTLDPLWNRKASGEDKAIAGPDLFPRYDAEALQPVPWLSIEIMPRLPLFHGFDYSSDSIADLASEEAAEPVDDREYLPPLVLFERPDAAGEYVVAQEMGRLADTEPAEDGDAPGCTVWPTIRPGTRALRLRVTGQPQHFIGGEEFVGTTEDEVAGYYDFRDMLATLALTNGLRIEERYPADVATDRDQVRIHEITLPDHYQAVYVAPATVVGTKADGTPERSDGGWIERPVGMRAEIKALCRMAHAWYSEPHYVLSLTTTRIFGSEKINLGNLVVRVGDDTDPNNGHQRDILSPITEIRVSWPTAVDSRPVAPSMSLTTSAGELDPLQLVPDPLDDARIVTARRP